jgi:hypothetical protein
MRVTEDSDNFTGVGRLHGGHPVNFYFPEFPLLQAHILSKNLGIRIRNPLGICLANKITGMWKWLTPE